MARRTRAQWLALIEDQQSSNLSVVDFCQQHGINAKYFYARKSTLLKPQSSFVPAIIPSTPRPDIQLNHQATTLQVAGVSPQWLAELILALNP